MDKEGEQSAIHIREEADLLEEFQLNFSGNEEEEEEQEEQDLSNSESDDASKGGMGSSVFRVDMVDMARSVSVWTNDFVFAPTVFEGLRPASSGPESALFRFVKKNVSAVAAITEALAIVRARDNAYRGLISVQKNIPYLKEDDGLDKHKLDIYLPLGAGESLHNLPLVIHFHGGGWVRGDRKDEFRGAPAVCRHYSMHGIIAVAPSYRLTDCPGHMEDAVAAVHWTCKHLINLGANPNKIFLSGHSAGGNIAANLACSTWLKEVLDKYQVRILGAVCISGVYSLLNPLGGAYSSMKNKGFDKLYRLKVFGNDLEVLTRHSPVAQLRLMLGEPPYPANQCKICNIARAISNWKRSDTKSESTVLSSRCANEIGEVPTDDDSSQQFNVKAESHQDTLRCLSTSFLVMNAEFDVGLESDGQRFVELLHRVYKMQQDEVGTDTFEPQYCLLPELGHATITLDEKALMIASDFILSVFQQSECQ